LSTLGIKVCMVVYNFFVDDNRVIKEAKTLVESGYEVTIFALHKRGLREKEEMHGFKVNRIYLTSEELPQYNIFQILKYFEFGLRCYFRIRKKDISICHCHDLEAFPIGYLITKSKRCKLIYDSHELWSDPRYLPFSRPSYPKIIFFIQKKLESFIMKRAKAVITVSDSIADFIARQNKIRRPYVIKNVPDLIKNRKTNKIKEKIDIINDKRKIILYQGGIQRGRGLENLILSMRWVDNAVLVILGDGVIKEELKGLAIKHKVEKKVFFMDAVPPGEILSYTCSADIGIMPVENVSLSYYYCLPNKLFEYLMARLPVVISDFPEMAKIVKKYEVGEVFNPEEPQDISRAINSLLNNSDKYKRYKENTKKVIQVYNWENEEKKLLRIYKEVLKQ